MTRTLSFSPRRMARNFMGASLLASVVYPTSDLWRPGSPLRIVFEVLREPMLALLIAGGVVYLLLGSLEEALILLAFA